MNSRAGFRRSLHLRSCKTSRKRKNNLPLARYFVRLRKSRNIPRARTRNPAGEPFSNPLLLMTSAGLRAIAVNYAFSSMETGRYKYWRCFCLCRTSGFESLSTYLSLSLEIIIYHGLLWPSLMLCWPMAGFRLQSLFLWVLMHIKDY